MFFLSIISGVPTRFHQPASVSWISRCPGRQDPISERRSIEEEEGALGLCQVESEVSEVESLPLGSLGPTLQDTICTVGIRSIHWRPGLFQEWGSRRAYGVLVLAACLHAMGVPTQSPYYIICLATCPVQLAFSIWSLGL